MRHPIMIQGTMSDAGKSIITAGLCRVFKQDGYSVAPFKSQNMALNSYITSDGLEMGRAQAVQAEACGIEPCVDMNPILLKPTTDMGSQVIVNGEVVGDMRAMDYYRRKKEYIPIVKSAYERLADKSDIVVIEGAGSPAEINLKQDDIVNMGMAELADAPVLLVGDIDRGGVFAQLIGTIMLLEEHEKERIKGLIINKFRGDVKILEPGLEMLEERCGKSVLGVVPYMDINIEDEDSLAKRLGNKNIGACIDIAVIRMPKISNFTDFQAFDMETSVSVRYVDSAAELGNPDAVILPGTKNTISDMRWLRESGLETAILRKKESGAIIFGICGGYQMLGHEIIDVCGSEGGGSIRGMGLLPTKTFFESEKMRTRVDGYTAQLEGIFAALSNKCVSGYEIHMGRTVPDIDNKDGNIGNYVISLSDKQEGCYNENVIGTYLHGVFDETDFRTAFIKLLCDRKGISYDEKRSMSYKEYKETQYDKLADILRESLDIEEIYRVMGFGR